MTGEAIMRQLISEAQKAVMQGKGGPFAAAVVKDGKIVAIGCNRVQADQDPTAHGEMIAIRRAAKQLGTRFPKGCVLYTTSQSCAGSSFWNGGII